MSYIFNGFFVQTGSKSKVDDIRERVLTVSDHIIVKEIDNPFKGVGVLMPELTELLNIDDENETERERVKEIMYKFESSIPELSKHFPKEKFVFLNADCLGGTCLYRGFICQDSQVIFEITNGSREAIIELVKFLGVKLAKNNIHFEPLVRRFWGIQ